MKILIEFTDNVKNDASILPSAPLRNGKEKGGNVTHDFAIWLSKHHSFMVKSSAVVNAAQKHR